MGEATVIDGAGLGRGFVVPGMLVPGQPVPTRLAWAGLAATGVAAVLAGLSGQVHGLAGTDLGGGLGLSADEASWINTAGSAAEGAAVLAAPPLALAFGARRLLLAALAATALLALAVRAVPEPMAVMGLRFAQGFAAAVPPVVMMSWALRAFPPTRRGLPLMLFAFASSAPAAVAALVAGEATLRLGGLGAFVWDLAWTPLAGLAVLLAMPDEPLAPARLRQVDWVGYALLAGAVMAILVLLSQGERRFWLATPWVAPLAAGAVVLTAAALIWLLVARAPFLDLALLAKPTFAIGLAEALSLRFGLLMASFAVPQALARLHGFRPEQAGTAIIWLGLGQIVGFPLAWAWLRRRDGRWSLAAGLALFALAALTAAAVDPSWEGAQFRPILLVAGLGQGLYLTSVLAFATHDIAPAAGQTASGLFNLTRVLGTAGATAAVGYALRIRENGHSARLVEGLSDANDAVADRLNGLTQTYLGLTADAGAAQSSALGGLAAGVQRQAYALAFGDVFLGISAVLAAFALLVPLLPRLPAGRVAPPPVAPPAVPPVPGAAP